ncbi:hypothetical protein EZ449_02500 [Pedobacter frigidisoli]|uniref:beta-N-acetylhexosaminidase n=1 Tax=Pedobacter frigidisoli TaxID=2530455 RepID=A0A4R0P806_9SPHI|nr:family 20 glycosylhydrolase [Pedobacter frigidisoli]TCD12935.1 hypothetical protein EZ449_02500 [Pedobacter frigidisoli]
MKNCCKLFILLLFLICNQQISFAQLNIIPLPVNIKENGNKFKIVSGTKIFYQKGLKEQALLLASALSPATGFDFEVKESVNAVAGIFLHLGKKDGNRERYQLTVNSSKVNISGKTGAGVFYGIQTLLQMLPPEIYSQQRKRNKIWELPGVEIRDEPSYVWRGMMLDVSRYFFSKEYVLRYIDMMAMYKMNTLHFHLIDDSGWRLEIKKYPKLTSVGAWRGEGAERTGGYYTQEDIKEMVAYAALRNVEIIPEIELPAHTLSALAAYPYLGCIGKNYEVQTQHSISKELYCVGKESTFEFLEDVFKEAAALFPSKYVHIGGDEAVYTRWEACPFCQKRKADLKLEKESQLQVYFNKRVQKMLNKYGKTIVGWDEIIDDGLTEKSVGMIWAKPERTLKAVAAGHDVVISLTKFLYFDMPEAFLPGEVQAASWVGAVPMEKVYQLNPLVNNLDEKYRSQILGASGTMWADQFIHGTKLPEMAPLNENRSEKYFDYLTLPRLSALAEVVWTPAEKQNWNDFQNRMRSQYNKYQQAGFGFRLPQPKVISQQKMDDGYLVKVENLVDGAQIRYTSDGTYPNAYSNIYSEAVKVKNLSDFYAITVLNRDQYSLPLFFPENYDRFKNLGLLLTEWKSNKIVTNESVVLDMNATGKIDQNGKYTITFQPVSGNSSLEIQSVAIYKNGIKISEDNTKSSAGLQKTSSYHFQIDNYETGAEFRIKVGLKGIDGNDTNGAVFIRRE